MRSVLILVLGCLLPCAVSAQEGTWVLEGTEWPTTNRYTATLHIERIEETWRVERTERYVSGKGRRLPPRTWLASRVEQDGSSLKVTFGESAVGAAGALALDPEGPTRVQAFLWFSADGRRVSEALRPSDSDAAWSYAFARGRRDRVLRLKSELSFADLFGEALDRYEASGIILVDETLHVVFDNAAVIAGVALDGSDAFLTDGSKKSSNLEGLTWDPRRERFYALVEAEKHDGEWQGRVWELDTDLEEVRRRWLEHELASGNKGYEGLAHVRHDGEDYLLGLLEGNKGKADAESTKPGHGRIEVFRRRSQGRWRHVTTLRLPARAAFFDYSGLDVRGDRIAVVSQTSSALWVGELNAEDWTISGSGTVYRFPRRGSRILYGAVEGVAWIDDRSVAVVSDASDDPHSKSQALHLFSLP